MWDIRFLYAKFQQLAKVFLPALYLIWTGLILGVSFIATPAKFQAPQMTLPLALEIGKVTFHVFNNIEWVVVAIIAVLTAIIINVQRKWLLFIFLATILVVQTFWLLPSLDIRSDAVITGLYAGPGSLHWVYVALEIMKMFLTLALAWMYLKR